MTTQQKLNENQGYTNAIRKITPAGSVTTLAGGTYSQQTYRDARSGFAMFFSIGGIAIDANGTVFATDPTAKTVRKVTADGAVTTIAGFPGEVGTAEATALDARFGFPNAVVFDSAGNLFVAEINGVRAARPALSDQATIDAVLAVTGGRRQLGSTTHNGSTLKWSFVRQPSASTASLSSTTIAEPTFTPDLDDVYELRLTASDSVSTSVTDVLLVTAPGNATPTGSNVKISGTNVSVTFPTVKSAGQTLIGQLPFPDALPDLTKLPLASYELTTTADFTPPARVCVALTGTVPDITRCSLYHREGSTFVDRTVTRDAATKTLCADVQTLGRIVLAGPTSRRRALAP